MTIDDDDLPLASLIEKKNNQKKPTVSKSSTQNLKSTNHDSDDDKPVSALIAKRSNISSPVAQASKVIDSDSEDNMTFTEIVKKRTREGTLPKKEQPPVKVQKKSSETKEKPASQSRSQPTKAQPRIGPGVQSATFYEDTVKGHLVQTLLCRWWYAIEWPVLAELPNPPEGFEPLDGFLGVYVSTRVSNH